MADEAIVYDLAAEPLRDLNKRLHNLTEETAKTPWRVLYPRGAHAVAAGVDVPVQIDILGHCGYYCAGMNQEGLVTVNGNVGTGVAENMMSGMVRVRGDASQSAGATAHGGLLIIEGDASARCAISLKGGDVVVGGSVGHMAAFMAQAGRLVVLGDASADLGDSIYEAQVFVRGAVASLGADCEEKEMTSAHWGDLAALLEAAGVAVPPMALPSARYLGPERLFVRTIRTTVAREESVLTVNTTLLSNSASEADVALHWAKVSLHRAQHSQHTGPTFRFTASSSTSAINGFFGTNGSLKLMISSLYFFVPSFDG